MERLNAQFLSQMLTLESTATLTLSVIMPRKCNQRLKLKRTHKYFYKVQQQLFTLPERKYCDFVVYSIDSEGNSCIVCDRINADPLHSKTVLQKLEAFLKICILPEVLGR